MSKYDYPDPNASSQKTPGPSRLGLWDMLTILTLLVTLCIGVYFVLIFVDPMSNLNPLKPLNPNTLPTATITPRLLDPTWTPSPTLEPTITDTPRPSATPYASPTLVSLITPSKTPTFTATPKAPFSATVTYIASTVFHPEAACNWLGVAGTVVDTKNADMLRMIIRLTGTLNGKRFDDILLMSGTARQYGISGFEGYLGPVPISSNDTLFVRLEDQAGLPLSDNVYIDTFNDCNKNLVLVRFKMNRK